MILGLTVGSPAFADQSLAGLANYQGTIPPYYKSGNGDVTPKTDWSYVKSNGLPNKGVYGTRTVMYANGTSPARELISLAQIPTQREFWLRLGALSIDNAWTASSDSFAESSIIDFRDNSNRVTAAITLQAASNTVTVKLIIYNPATSAVVTTSTVATFNQSGFPKDSYGNYALDIRIYFDEVAGYVQAYNTAAALLGEVLGRTLYNSSLPVIAGLAYPVPFVEYDKNTQIGFIILSTTTTFGMYALPLLTKAAGIHSDMLTGSYTALTEHKTFETLATPIKLEASTGQTKCADFKYTSMADIGLPANYVIDAVALKGLFTAINASGNNVTAKLTLSTDGLTFYDVGLAPIAPNLDLSTGLFQTKSALLTTNPANGNAWAVSDFANFYAGIKLEV